MAEQFRNAFLLGAVVFHNQQALAARLGIFLDARQCGFDPLGRGRLGDEGECTARHPVLAIFVQRDDLHRNVPGQRILLELAQHGPAQHVGQEHVERHGGGLVLLCELERVGAAHRDQHFEALLARQVQHDPGIVRIVFHHQQDRIAGPDLEAVVGNLLDRAFRRDERGWRTHRRHRGRRLRRCA